MPTPVDIDDRLNNYDRRLERMEQSLPPVLTKGDLPLALEKHPPKDDLRAAFELPDEGRSD